MQMSKAQSTHRERVLEIELMKVVAIAAMVFVHVFERGVNLDFLSPARYAGAFLINFLGDIPSAGVFMFAMGWGAAFSKHATVETYLKRGLSLFVLGLMINLFEEYLPAILVPDTYGPLNTVLPSILATDIYFFAALSCLYFALMKALEARARLKILVSILLVGLCSCVNVLVGFESFTTGNEWLDTILGLFIRVNEYSYFPLISWIAFPVIGYGIACLYQRIGMEKFVGFATLTGTAAIFVSYIFIRVFNMPDATIVDVIVVRDGVYYALHPVYALNGYGIIMLEFLLAHSILQLMNNRMPDSLLAMSKTVTQIYIVQWAVIALLSPLLVPITSIWVNIIIGVFVLLVSCYGGALLKKTNLIRV